MISDILPILAERLRESSLSLREIERGTGISRRKITDVVEGKRHPASLPFAEVVALASFLGIANELPIKPLLYPVPVYGPIERDLAGGITPLPERYVDLVMPEASGRLSFLAELTPGTPQYPSNFLPANGYLLLGKPYLPRTPQLGLVVGSDTPLLTNRSPSNFTSFASVLAWYPILPKFRSI